MRIRTVGRRGVLFTFQDGDSPMGGETSVYLIEGGDRFYLCDTFLGSRFMNVVKDRIKESPRKDLVIFNSHSDYDHVWGNGAFDGCEIVAHELARRRMEERWEYDFENLERFRDGDVLKRLPNVTFSDRLVFEDDEIEFRYLPGHTLCSSVCIDRRDSVIFVGDLVEDPLPLTLWSDLVTFTESLKTVLKMSCQTVISGHSGIVAESLIRRNLEYLKSLFLGEEIDVEEGEETHSFNTKYLEFLHYEDKAREILGERFDFVQFMREFWQMLGVERESLRFESRLIRQTPSERLEEIWPQYEELLMNRKYFE